MVLEDGHGVFVGHGCHQPEEWGLARQKSRAGRRAKLPTRHRLAKAEKAVNRVWPVKHFARRAATRSADARILNMVRSLTVVMVGLVLMACAAAESEPAVQPGPVKAATTAASVVPNSDAYFAGGCFWGVEHYLEKMPGVASVESGYMGGSEANPSYEQVVRHATGHLETVRVRYDSKLVSYQALAKRFFEVHDPTQADGQGPDIGPQYRSVVFYGSSKEKATVQELVGQLKARGYQVATRLELAKTFWPAEKAHQDYYARTGKQPYCHVRVRRFETSLN
ncbi:MAG: peptide-methionine (S)-S-oxide reductase MsrA [Polyangiaceae bacterium]|nr:peptide-methionine (S)-S-oxide reductase MsrA [Polyangiaceae bacterium]